MLKAAGVPRYWLWIVTLFLILATIPQTFGALQRNRGALALIEAGEGEGAIRSERLDLAIRNLRQAQSTTKNAAEVMRLVGLALLRQHRETEAIHELELAQQS